MFNLPTRSRVNLLPITWTSFKDLKGFPVTGDLKEFKEIEVRLDFKETEDPQVYLEIEVQWVHKVNKEHKVLKGFKDSLERILIRLRWLIWSRQMMLFLIS